MPGGGVLGLGVPRVVERRALVSSGDEHAVASLQRPPELRSWASRPFDVGHARPLLAFGII